MRVLITGGAGFIGTVLVEQLASRGHDVTVLDTLSEQVHGIGADFPPELESRAECVRGDVCDAAVLGRLLSRQDALVHLAAETGTAQSMYRVRHYSDKNISGTAQIFDSIVNDRSDSLSRIVVASSRSIYGEGKYFCPIHGEVYPNARSAEAMSGGDFAPKCPICAGEVELRATSEDAPLRPSSFYGLSKQVQEQMALLFGETLNVDVFALRFQNVYGPGQSLLNPYTGVLSVFSNLARAGKGIEVFEDGLESRDFVHVDDVVSAITAAVDGEARGLHRLNVGSGVSTSVLDVAGRIARYFDCAIEPRVTGEFRLGDIRHNVADVSAARTTLGYEPSWKFDDGITSFLDWTVDKFPADNEFGRTMEELKTRGLLLKSKVA